MESIKFMDQDRDSLYTPKRCETKLENLWRQLFLLGDCEVGQDKADHWSQFFTKLDGVI